MHETHNEEGGGKDADVDEEYEDAREEHSNRVNERAGELPLKLA